MGRAGITRVKNRVKENKNGRKREKGEIEKERKWEG